MFKEFKISTLFDWQNGNTDLKKEHINGKGVPVVSSGVENTGIIGSTDVEARILPAHTITVDMFGNVYYRDFEYKEVTHARVFTLIPKGFELDVQTGLYFVSSLKMLSKMYSYNNMCSYAKVSNLDILLPVIENPNPDHVYTVDDIDWEYMRERIKELERERIKELERERIKELDAYLKVTGLNDYELNDEDKAVLCISDEKYIEEFVGDVIWKKVKAQDLFKIYHGKRLTKSDRIPGNIPFITAGEANQGVAEYIGNEVDIYKSPITVDMFGNCFYHDENCSGDDNIYFFIGDYDKKIKLYISSVIARTIKGIYSYSKQFRQNDADNLEIELPFDSIGNLHKLYIYIYIYIYTSYRKNNYQGNDSLEKPPIRDIARNYMRFGSFKLEQLFESQTGDVDLQQKDINNKGYFFINSGIENRGVKGKTDRPAKVFKAGTITIDFWGNAYYRDFDYVMATHNHVFSLSGNIIKNEKVGHYIIGKLSKLPKLFSYNNMATWNKLKVLDISLPIKFDASDDYNIDDIDFEYMEKYIRAIEKVVIKDVVVWKDIVIEETRKVIEQA